VVYMPDGNHGEIDLNLFSGTTPVLIQDIADCLEELGSDREREEWVKKLPMSVRPPWQAVWVECEYVSGDQTGWFVRDVSIECPKWPRLLILNTVFRVTETDQVGVWPEISVPISEDGGQFSSKRSFDRKKCNRATAREVWDLAYPLRLSMQLFHVRNMRVVDTPIPRSQRRRSMKDPKDLREWRIVKTLELTLPPREVVAMGNGNGASDDGGRRRHGVRGYFVDLTSHPLECFRGIWWVPPHERGDENKGFVAKVYKPKVDL